MTRRRLAPLVAALTLIAATPVLAQQAPQGAPPPQTQPDPERPEYRARRLPTDVFRPSEKVQEDVPVPFPEDI